MATSTVQSIKLAIVSATGLSKDALHIYVGLAVFLIVAQLSKRGLASWRPWLAVLVMAGCGELLDMRDDFIGLGFWRWRASLHDVINTCFWPTILLTLARCRASVFRSGPTG
jgi:hypothetical protein